MSTPRSADKKAFFLSISKAAAIIHPVQAPVPGSGTPTKRTSPQNPTLSILERFFWIFLSSQFPNALRTPIFELRKYSKKRLNKMRINRNKISNNTDDVALNRIKSQ